MSNINALPLLVNRQQHKEIYLTNEKDSLFRLMENILKEQNSNRDLFEVNMDCKPVNQSQDQTNNSTNQPKIHRRLSCGPPAKPTWRRATTLRRIQPPCLTLGPAEETQEKIDDEQPIDEDTNLNLTTVNFDEEDNDAFVQSPDQQSVQHQQIVPKPSSNTFPSSLSRCTSVSSTQSISTPPIFGLSPSTPYPGGKSNPNGNIFFPIGKQVSVPEYSPVSSPIIMGSFDPLSFLPTNSTASNNVPLTDPNSKVQKKKRRRSDISADELIQTLNNQANDNRSPILTAKLPVSTGEQSNIKRGKKPIDKSLQQQQQQQIVRQKSSFKVTDSPTTGLVSQQSIPSSDDTSNELKPLKVVIKRVGDSGNASNDESQQQAIKQRKKQQQQQQQHMANTTGILPTTMRKLPSSGSSSGSSPAILVKTESIDPSQLNTDSNPNAMMGMNDGTSQGSRDRSRPSSQSNSSTPLSSSVASQPRSAAPQPPIVLKIQRSKVYSGQDQSSSSTPSTTLSAATTSPSPSSNTIPSSLKEALKPRARSIPAGSSANKQQVTSPPMLAAKLTSPSTATANNPLPPTSVNSLFRIPRKSSSQEVAVKPKTEPSTPTSNASPVLPKTPLLPTPGVRPSPPPSQIGSWQSPPTQQPSRFHQSRPRSSWSQQQAPRNRAPATPPNVPSLNSGHSSLPNYAQQPRSILKKPSSNDNQTSDLLYMPSSELPGLNEQRMGSSFVAPLPPASRTSSSPGLYDDNDDDSSPQAQLVIDTSSTTANNALLPYTIVPGSSSSGAMDSFDQQQESNPMMSSSQQHMNDDSLPNQD